MTFSGFFRAEARGPKQQAALARAAHAAGATSVDGGMPDAAVTQREPPAAATTLATERATAVARTYAEKAAAARSLERRSTTVTVKGEPDNTTSTAWRVTVTVTFAVIGPGR